MIDDPEHLAPEGEAVAERAKRERLTKKGLVAEVAARTGMSRRDSAKATDAVLEAIRDAVDADKDVLVPPLGRMSPGKLREGKTGAQVRMLRLRLGSAEASEEAEGATEEA